MLHCQHSRMDSPSGQDPVIRRAIQEARLDFAFGSLPLAITFSLVLAAMTAAILEPFVDDAALSGWFAVLAVINGVRLLQQRNYRRRRDSGNIDYGQWEKRLFIGCLGGGVIWGVSAMLFFPERAELQFFLAFVIAGVSAGAVSGLAVAPAAAYAFVIPCVLPLAIRLFAGGSML